ncbi:M1 family aminopeptidase [Spirosoma spitsbergense]|uniref:M1 family aminopeptidase n=1 Tax=Spirosoma spitsbergense TaxID=431554 RepID=UPI00038005D6|nr:M1 family aminopeptidase [Spirosoma spitsbergense]
MKSLYVLFLLFTSSLANAQLISEGIQACQMGKMRAAERLATNPRARLAYPGDASIDVTYYGLDLRLTTTPNNLRGAATITLKSTVTSLNSFFLDLSTASSATEGIRVDSVKVGTQKVTFQHALNKLTITPPQPVANGQALTLTVYYQGVPSYEQESFKFDKHENTADPVIWSLSEPYGASNWFPCRDTPADKADSSSVRITAPAQFISVSNGKLISTTTNTDGTKTYFWKNSYPIAQYLISIAVSNYAQLETPFAYGSQTLPITHYIYPEDLPTVQASLATTPAIMQLFTNRFGPYPFLREKYGHAQFPRNNGGMEHQTISSMGVSALTPAVIAHELAHQWFGDKITCRDWQNIWLNEGFASYGEAVYAELVGGQMGYQTYMANFMNGARLARGSIYVQNISGQQTLSDVYNIFDPNRSYSKGATVLHMLRGVVGDSTFYKTLRTYAATPALAYSTAVTEDFQAVAQQVSGPSSPGKNLDYFFRQWIYGEGFPSYTATITGGGTSATVRLQQTNALSASPASFTMPVQMRVLSTAGDTTITVFNDQPDQTFTLSVRGTITNVVVDPNNWILKNLKTTSTLTTITDVAEPALTGLRVYPNPTAETLTVDFTLTASGPVALALTNLSGQALGQLAEPNLPSGNYSRVFNLRGVSAGRYTITVQTSAGAESRVVVVP